MIPKKANTLYRQVSEDLGIDEDLLETFIEFYYKDIKDKLTNLKHPRVNVEGLGQFVAKPTVVKKAIVRYSKSLENHDTSTFGAYHNKKSMEVKLDLLIKLERKIIEQQTKKELFKKNKYENKSKDNLEE